MLSFKYCECGCHGSESERIGESTFWIGRENDLHKGHGWMSPLIKNCDSYDEAVELATEMARELVVREEEHLLRIRAQLRKAVKKLPTFKQELLAQFPGKENAALRRLLSDCNSDRAIRQLSDSMAFTEETKKKLILVAEAFLRG